MNIPPPIHPGETATILAALQFSVAKSLSQIKGDTNPIDYIGHRIVVTEILSRVGHVTDITILTAAILHHLFNGTQAELLELDESFGKDVRLLVQELAEDKALSVPERKEALLDRVRDFSAAAKLIAIAEKISRLQEISSTEPPGWSFQQKSGYMTWLARVVAGCRGVNPALDEHFDVLLQERIHDLLYAA